MSDFLQPHEVTARTSFQTADMPELGLRDDVDGLPFRVYCLRCGDGKKLYVGVVHRSDLKERLEKHWQADATLFTTTHRCFEVCLIRPFASPAAEALLFYALLEKFGNSVLLGGWTQTLPTSTPLSRLLLNEAEHNLRQRCFKCGLAGHYAVDCKIKSMERTCWYPCKRTGCGERLYLNTRGMTPQDRSQEFVEAAVPGNNNSSQSSRITPQDRSQECLDAAVPGTSHSSNSQHQQTASAPTSALPGAARESCAKLCKRPASSSLSTSCESSFEEVWHGVRKRPRPGHQAELGSAADLLNLMHTGAALRAVNDLRPRVNGWANKWEWRKGRDWDDDISDFCNRKKGGGRGGFGISKGCATQVFEERNRP